MAPPPPRRGGGGPPRPTGGPGPSALPTARGGAAGPAGGRAPGNRGRAPANRIPADTRARLVELARTRYAGVNHAHLAELLAEREGIIVAERALRRILDEAGLAPVRTRRPARHRTRR